MARNLMILSSIAECMKAIDYQTEVGATETTDVGLRGEVCTCAEQRRNAWPGYQGHRLVRLCDNTLVCRDCGKLFHTQHQKLTPKDRIEFEALDPKRPFAQRFEL
jgi:hypothetical protein